MKKLWPIIGLVLLTVILTRTFLPRSVQAPAPPPLIVTVHDTLHDTLTIHAPPNTVTKTVNVVIRETVHDTVRINVGCDAAQRSHIWPVLTVAVGKKVGDTTRVQTFDLQTGRGGSSLHYTPGPLLGVYADSTPTPRLIWGDPPIPSHTSGWTKLLWGGVGYATCQTVNGLTRLVRP